MNLVFLLLALLVACISSTSAAGASISSPECGACVMIITEMEAAIAEIDPKKKITVGSFRVDGQGNQKGLNEIPYARSDVHLNEILDNICDKSKKYVQAIHPETGKQIYVHEDKVLHYKRITSSALTSRLQSSCSDFIDEHENDILQFLKTSKEDPVKDFCYGKLNVCSSVDVKPYPEEKEEEAEATTPTPQVEEDEAENDEL